MIQPTHDLPSPVAPATGNRKVYPSNKVQAGLLFLTATTYKRVPVFREHALCEVFFRELDFYRSKFGFRLHGYVLLPDHFHLVLNFPAGKRFRDFLRDFKSAVGRVVIDWAKENNRVQLLARLRLAASPKRRRDPEYCVQQPNSYARAVTSPAMFKQKLEYIHANPVRAGRVQRAIDYDWSSLRNYEKGSGVIRVDPHDLILD